MVKIDEHLVLLVEDIDHTIRNVVFECLVLNDHGNSSISSTSPSKFVVFSYFHAYVIDTMGTTTIIVNIRGGLIKTHVQFIKKGPNAISFVAKKIERGVQSIKPNYAITCKVSFIFIFFIVF
jgi:hypothetical protein